MEVRDLLLLEHSKWKTELIALILLLNASLIWKFLFYIKTYINKIPTERDSFDPKELHSIWHDLHRVSLNFATYWIYSRLSLSRSQTDPLYHFEISVLRLIRFAGLWKFSWLALKVHSSETWRPFPYLPTRLRSVYHPNRIIIAILYWGCPICFLQNISEIGPLSLKKKSFDFLQYVGMTAILNFES